MRFVNPAIKLMTFGGLALCGLVLILPGNRDAGHSAADPSEPRDELLLYCAASMRAPIERIAQQYRKEFGVDVQLQFGGSNTLLSQIEVGRLGDLYIAADESYLDLGREKELVDAIIPLATMKPVVGVAKGNPLSVDRIEDLLEMRIAAGNPDQTAVGKVARRQLTATGDWEAIDAAIRRRGVYKPTVGDVANDLALGGVDAGIIWDAVANQYAQIDIVELPEISQAEVKVSVGVLRSTKDPAAALKFAQYLTASERGQQAFSDLGYVPVKGNH